MVRGRGGCSAGVAPLPVISSLSSLLSFCSYGLPHLSDPFSREDKQQPEQQRKCSCGYTAWYLGRLCILVLTIPTSKTAVQHVGGSTPWPDMSTKILLTSREGLPEGRMYTGTDVIQFCQDMRTCNACLSIQTVELMARYQNGSLKFTT